MDLCWSRGFAYARCSSKDKITPTWLFTLFRRLLGGKQASLEMSGIAIIVRHYQVGRTLTYEKSARLVSLWRRAYLPHMGSLFAPLVLRIDASSQIHRTHDYVYEVPPITHRVSPHLSPRLPQSHAHSLSNALDSILPWRCSS